MYILHCPLYGLCNVLCTLYTVHNNYIVHSTVYTVHYYDFACLIFVCSVISINYYIHHGIFYVNQYIMYIIHCTLVHIKYTLYIIHCTLYNVHYIIYTGSHQIYNVQCTLYIIHCTLVHIKYTLYIIHCTVVLCIMIASQINHYTMYIVQCTILYIPLYFTELYNSGQGDESKVKGLG